MFTSRMKMKFRSCYVKYELNIVKLSVIRILIDQALSLYLKVVGSGPSYSYPSLNY
jgi:hypothetical protein